MDEARRSYASYIGYYRGMTMARRRPQLPEGLEPRDFDAQHEDRAFRCYATFSHDNLFISIS